MKNKLKIYLMQKLYMMFKKIHLAFLTMIVQLKKLKIIMNNKIGHQKNI